MTLPEISFRACCADTAGQPRPPMLSATMALTAGPTIALPARARAEADAFHEAGHCAVGIALGWPVVAVTIDGPAHVRWVGGCRPRAEVAAVAMAGAIAERWRNRWIVRPDDKALLADLARVRGLEGGACDQCRAARAAIVETGHGPDAAAINRLRDLELWTIDAIKSPPIWAAIRALATKLMAEGTQDGAGVEAICGDFFPPGALTVPTLETNNAGHS
jgi:hypothetical protein